MKDSTSPTTSVQVISRIFAVLDALEGEHGDMPLKLVSEKTGLHPSTAHRILNDLTLGRFVERTGPGHYRLGMRLLELGNAVKARVNLLDIAAEPMISLHDSTGCSAYLYVCRGTDTTCLAHTALVKQHTQVLPGDGVQIPLASAVIAKAFSMNLLAMSPNNASEGEPAVGTLASCMAAAPVVNDSGEVAASLAIVSQSGTLSDKQTTALVSAARLISQRLGSTYRIE